MKSNKWTLLFALPVLLGLSYAVYPPLGFTFLYHYKLSCIDRGILYFDPHWGWIDTVHYDFTWRRLDPMKNDLLRSSADPVHIYLEGNSLTAYGSKLVTERSYSVRKHELKSPNDASVVACRIAFNMALEEEAAQETAGILTGLPWSAWQFDDTPSSLLACINFVEGLPLSSRSRTRAMIDSDRLRFNREGAVLVRGKIVIPQLPQTASSGQIEGYARILPSQ